MFLPINLFSGPVVKLKEKGRALYDRCTDKATEVVIKYIIDKINSADQQTVDRITEGLVNTGESFYYTILHIKRLVDSKHASRFFEKEQIYIFDGMIWLQFWPDEPIRQLNEIDFTKCKKRIPRGDVIFVIGVKQEYINHIVLHVIHNEDIGYISLSGDMAFEPNKYFKRL